MKMIDKELSMAEELDTFVEARQVGQPIELPPDLPLEEWQLADELLGISAVVLPNDQFLDYLVNQTQSAARKSKTSGIPENRITSIGQSLQFATRRSPYPQFRRTPSSWLSTVASMIIDVLIVCLAPASLPQSEQYKRTPND
jgi:hypothetical protein